MMRVWRVGIILGMILGSIIGVCVSELYRMYHPVTVTETVTEYIPVHDVKWYRVDPDTGHYTIDLSGDYETDIDSMIAWEGVTDT